MDCSCPTTSTRCPFLFPPRFAKRSPTLTKSVMWSSSPCDSPRILEASLWSAIARPLSAMITSPPCMPSAAARPFGSRLSTRMPSPTSGPSSIPSLLPSVRSMVTCTTLSCGSMEDCDACQISFSVCALRSAIGLDAATTPFGLGVSLTSACCSTAAFRIHSSPATICKASVRPFAEENMAAGRVSAAVIG